MARIVELMETPSQIVWRIHGAERRDDCEDASGRCWVCAGEVTRGQRGTGHGRAQWEQRYYRDALAEMRRLDPPPR
jgi:hypothetical protein